MKTSVQITVTGPGGVIDNEILLIRDLLLSKGATVNVVNDYPNEDVNVPWRNCEGMDITITAKGQPWGG